MTDLSNADPWELAVTDAGRVTVPWRAVGAGPFGTVKRPVVPVQLAAPSGDRPIYTQALVDSGADFTQGSIELLQQLGVPLQECECQFDRLNGGESLTYRTPIDLQVAEAFTIRFASMQFRGWGAFQASCSARLVLGSNDVLKVLKATLAFGETTLEPLDPDAGPVWDQPHDVLEAATWKEPIG